MVMAAGQSRRFNGIKQLAQIDGVGMLQGTLDKVINLTCQDRLLVLGHEAENIKNTLRRTESVKVIVAENWSGGIGCSIATGCKSLSDDTTHLLILLADQVALSLQDIEQLIKVSQEYQDHIVCAQYDEKRGVPAIFPIQYKEQLATLHGDQGAKRLLQNDSTIAVPMASAEIDIDTQQQLISWQQANGTSK